MSSWSTIRIGGTEYGGSQRHINDRQAQLFNSSDLITVGSVGDPEFQRLYRITVGELRIRLEALGYTLAQVRDDIRTAPDAVKDKHLRSYGDESLKFIRYLKQITIDQLLDLASSWRAPEKDVNLENMFRPNFGDFPAALLEFVQGGTVDLLGDDIWIYGHHFERLLCEIYADDECFELDFSSLVDAGYYEADDSPLGNLYDEALASFTPGSFRIGQILLDEESETLEFKSIDTANPCKSISSMLVRYAIGFLNRTGGRLLFGVDDAGCVLGVKLSRQDRDELPRQINAACAVIVPAIPLGTLVVSYHPVIGSGKQLGDLFVIEVKVQRHRATEMYFKPNGETWVRIGTETRSLKGHELFVYVCAHYSQADVLVTALSDRARIAAEEVDRLRHDGRLHQDVIVSKEQEVEDLQQALATVNGLLQETNVLCPDCGAPLITRHMFPIVGYVGEHEVDSEAEYLEYECGYACRDDQLTPISKCRQSPSGRIYQDVSL